MKPRHNIAKVTKSTERNSRLSDERLAVERCLQEATASLSCREIAAQTKVTGATVGAILQRLRHDGRAANTGTGSATKWHMRRANASPAKPECRYPTAIYTANELKPFSARAGALDAFSLPSRGIKA